MLFINDNFNSSSIIQNLKTKRPFELASITPDEVLKALSTMKNSAPGAVGIDSRVFRDCSEELKEPITSIFNLCIASNCMPDEWKIAYITPIYKSKGAKSELDNYRPISVLSPVSKIFERLIGT